MTALTPKDLLDLFHTGLKPQASVAVDTETSGLHPDDGARISTVSVAWPDYEGEWVDFANSKAEMTWNIEEVAPGYFVPIVSAAWPFDQGIAGKPEDTGQYTLWPDAENLEKDQWVALLDWLELVGQDVGLDMHNALFDVQMFSVGCRLWPELVKRFLDLIAWDSQNVNHLLWPLQPHPETGSPTTSLKPTSQVLFGVEAADESKLVQAYLKKKRLPAGRWDLMPWDIVGPYADKDARLTSMLKLRQIYEIEHGAGNWIGDYDAVMDKVTRRLEVMKVLCRMEWRGLPFPEVESRDAGDLCRQRAALIAERLPFEPTDNEAKNFFFGDGHTSRGEECLGLPAYELTEKGNVSLTAAILERMVADKVPHADRWAEYNKVTTAASMWYDGYADKMGSDGRLRCRYRQNGTTSTRFSVERVNLQAIPQDYRLSSFEILADIPTPRQLVGLAVERMPGWSLWELDLQQAELRVAALFADCKKMLTMMYEGADLHTYTTKELFHIEENSKEFFQMRQVGKRGNFSLCFGSGGTTFNKMVRKETGIDLGESFADQIVRDWNNLYPEFHTAIDRHQSRVVSRQIRHKKGWVDFLNKERRWFTRYEDTHKAFNQRVQGNLAQFGIDWMLWSDNYLIGCGLEEQQAGLLLTIHDSQVLLVPDTDEGEKMVNSCAEYGNHLWKQWFPDVPGGVDIKKWGAK